MSTSTTWITTRIESILVLAICLGALSLLATPAWLQAKATGSESVVVVDPECDKHHRRPEHGSLGNIGAKLADPTSNIWALLFNIQAPTFYDDDLNTGDPEVGGNVVFEPVMPFPLYGKGNNQWKMITRPVIPIIFSQPIPTGAGTDSFSHIGGLGDIELPLLLNPRSSVTRSTPTTISRRMRMVR
jgi:hypothetical protein